jgi:hypothetical protein
MCMLNRRMQGGIPGAISMPLRPASLDCVRVVDAFATLAGPQHVGSAS